MFFPQADHKMPDSGLTPLPPADTIFLGITLLKRNGTGTMTDRFKIHEQGNGKELFGSAASLILKKSADRCLREVAGYIGHGCISGTPEQSAELACKVWNAIRAYGAVCATLGDLPPEEPDQSMFADHVQTYMDIATDSAKRRVSASCRSISRKKTPKLPPDVPANDDDMDVNGALFND